MSPIADILISDSRVQGPGAGADADDIIDGAKPRFFSISYDHGKERMYLSSSTLVEDTKTGR